MSDAAFNGRPVLLSIHGIRTTGRWQKALTEATQAAGIHYRPLDYGYFLALSLLMPWSRRKKVEWFQRECEASLRDLAPGQRASIIAHSFGSYLLAAALAKYSDLKFDKVILCGSIVRPDYPWSTVILRRDQVRQVLNEAGGRDAWAALVTWVVADAGPSGVVGFEDLADGRVVQRVHADHGHSDYFYSGNYERVWIPFIRTGRFEAVEPMPRARLNWRFAALLSVVVLAVGVVAAFKLLPVQGGADAPVEASDPAAMQSGLPVVPQRRVCEVLDDDGDGVNNCEDDCPDSIPSHPLGTDGCLALERIVIPPVQFDYDRSNLRPDSIAALQDVVRLLQQYPELRLQVNGHTSTRQSASYNLRVSERRADAVFTYLTSQGIDATRLEGPNGYGETRPLGPAFRADGSPDYEMIAQSERVELVPIR